MSRLCAIDIYEKCARADGRWEMQVATIQSACQTFISVFCGTTAAVYQDTNQQLGFIPPVIKTWKPGEARFKFPLAIVRVAWRIDLGLREFST